MKKSRLSISGANRLLFATALFLLLLPFAGWAQSFEEASETDAPAAQFGEVIDVELVNVDVWVTDEEGRPVSGLTADDFRVVHDDQEVEITHFVEQIIDAPATDPADSNPSAAEDSADSSAGDAPASAPSLALEDSPSVVVYFDQLRTHPGHVESVVGDLEELLDAQVLDAKKIMVLRQDTTVHIEAPFGSSRGELRDAFDRLKEAAVEGMEIDTHSIQAVRQLQDLWRINEQRQGSAQSGLSQIPSDTPAQPGGGSVLDRFRGGGGRDSFGGDLCADYMSQAESMVLDWGRFEARRTRTTLDNLRNVGSFLAGLPGVKSLVYVSDGIDTQPGGALAAYLQALCPGGSRVSADLDAEAMDREFLKLTRDLNARRVTVYAVQAGGLTGSRFNTASQEGFNAGSKGLRGQNAYETRRRAGEREGLQMIAEETGGKLLVRRNDLSSEMKALTTELRPHYSLAYRLPEPKDGNTRRQLITRITGQKVDVEVAGKSDVRFRRGWAVVDPDRLLADRLDGALFLGLVENPLQVRLGAAETSVDDRGLVTLPLRIMVPAANLTPSLTPFSGQGPADAETVEAFVKLRVVARHLQTQDLVTKEHSFKIRIPAEPRDELSVLPVELSLPPGAFTVGVAVRDENSQTTSVISTELDLSSG